MFLCSANLSHCADVCCVACCPLSSVVGGQNLSYVLLDGVAEVYAQHAAEGVDSKGIKVHFTMDDSGLLNLTGAEAVFEKSSGAETEPTDEGTLAKLSSAFSNLFSGDGT